MDSFNSRKRTSPEDFLPSNFDNKKHHLPDDKDQIFSSEEEERSDANKVITIRLVSEPSDLLDSNPLNFPPEFTNQIFGEEEQIFGYEDLQIKINFMASQFYANIDINYSKKEDNADDLYELFDKFFRGGYFKDKTEFSQLFPQEKNFKPYGKIIKKFEINQTNYEVFFLFS